MNKNLKRKFLICNILIGFLSIAALVSLFLYIPLIMITVAPVVIVVTLAFFIINNLEKGESTYSLANYEKIKNKESELFQIKVNKMIDDEVCLNCGSNLDIIQSAFSGKDFCRVKCKNCGYDIKRLHNRLIVILNKPRVLLN